jgi:lipopolysaccharide export system permease protein
MMPKLLFIASNRIGDAVLSTGALAYAIDQIGADQVTIACGPLPAPLFRAVPGLVDLHIVSKRKARAFEHWMALYRALRGSRYDLAVDLRGTLLTLGLSAQRRIIHRKNNAIRHKITDLTETMRAPSPLEPRLWLDRAARAEADKLAPGGGAPLLVLGPGTNFIGKQWPEDRFALAALRLLGPGGALAGGRAVLLGGPEDRPVLNDIAGVLAEAKIETAMSAGQLDLLACGALLQRATLFIGNDSGMMHLAAAAGAPTLGLFGPSDERVYGPYGARTKALRGRAYADIMAIGYMPDITRSLMHDVTVEAVVAAAEELLTTGGLR